MADKTLADEIITIVQSYANNNPPPTMATITKIYPNGYIDAKLPTGKITYIECIGTPNINDTTVIIYSDGDTPKAITESSTDLTDYYTKQEVDSLIAGGSASLDIELTMDTLSNGYLKIEANLIRGD